MNTNLKVPYQLYTTFQILNNYIIIKKHRLVFTLFTLNCVIIKKSISIKFQQTILQSSAKFSFYNYKKKS